MSSLVTLLGTPRQWARDFAAAAAIGLFLGVIGPFGSFNGGPVELRVPFWIGNICIGFACLTIVARASILTAQKLDLPAWFALAVGVAIGSAPLSLALAWFSRVFWMARPSAEPFLQWYGQTLAISEPCSFVYYYVMTARQTLPELHASPAPAPAGEATPLSPAPPHASSIMDRLPTRLGGDLLCLQMEDHYVRIHTVKGSDLVLTSLREAMSHFGEMDGLQVHRSWWVRRSAVAAVVTKGRNLSLRLRNDLEVPVSRASVARLRASGWLDSAEGASPDNPRGVA